MKNATTFNNKLRLQRRSRTKLPVGTGEPEEVDVAEALAGVLEEHTPNFWPLRVRRKPTEALNVTSNAYKTADERTKTSMILFILVLTITVFTFIFYAGWRHFVGTRLY